MLLIRIEKSMNRVLEALDNCDVSLLLEANAEFEKSYVDLVSSSEAFYSMVNQFKPLQDFAAEVGKMVQDLKSIDDDIKNAPEEATFKNLAAMKGQSDEDNPAAEAVKTMSSTASSLSMYVNGLKDAVIEIAGWFEQFPDLFSVGKNGIIVRPEFVRLNQGKPLDVTTFSKPSGIEILKHVAEIEVEEELMAHFRPAFDSKNDLKDEEVETAWEEFHSKIDKVGEGAQKAFQAAEQALKNVKPDEALSKEVPSKSILGSILGSLFGGSAKGTPASMEDMSAVVIGDKVASDAGKGVFSMTFEDLQKLIVELLKMSDSANAAGAQALAGINKQNEESMQLNDKQKELGKTLKDIVQDEELATRIAAATEAAGAEGGDLSKINKDEFIKELKQLLDNDEEKLNAVLAGLDIESSDTEEDKKPSQFATDVEDKQKLAKNLHKYFDHEGYPDVEKNLERYQNMIFDFIDEHDWEKGGIDKLLDQSEFAQELIKQPTGKEDLEGFFEENKEGLQEMKLILRWGRLAGIIKG